MYKIVQEQKEAERREEQAYEGRLRNGDRLSHWERKRYRDLLAKRGVFVGDEYLDDPENFKVGPDEVKIQSPSPDETIEPLTADEIISKYKKGSIREVFHEDFLDKTLDQIKKMARKKGEPGRKAKTAQKLLKDKRFDKGDNRK